MYLDKARLVRTYRDMLGRHYSYYSTAILSNTLDEATFV